MDSCSSCGEETAGGMHVCPYKVSYDDYHLCDCCYDCLEECIEDMDDYGGDDE